mgnify:CR=1 FL=1
MRATKRFNYRFDGSKPYSLQKNKTEIFYHMHAHDRNYSGVKVIDRDF